VEQEAGRGDAAEVVPEPGRGGLDTPPPLRPGPGVPAAGATSARQVMPLTGRVPGRWDDVPMRDVVIREDMIRLGQFLKLAGVIDSGGETKERIAAGEVEVNGEVDTRRGRQLHRGDVITVDGEDLRVA
jgi:ribosome-associated protein